MAGNPTHNPVVIEGNQDVPGAHSAALTGEEWRWVPGYEGLYEISDQGRVYSHHNKRILKGSGSHGGYSSVHLSDSPKRRPLMQNIHTLVMLAFVGPRPDGMMVRHLDGNPQHSVLSNMRYGTPKENSDDMVRHGRSARDRITHCPHGHEYTEENTQWTAKDGNPHASRHCKTCDKARWARSHPPKQPITHCKNGHEFTPENTRWAKKGAGRTCITCSSQRAAAFRASHVEEQKIYFRNRYLASKRT